MPPNNIKEGRQEWLSLEQTLTMPKSGCGENWGTGIELAIVSKLDEGRCEDELNVLWDVEKDVLQVVPTCVPIHVFLSMCLELQVVCTWSCVHRPRTWKFDRARMWRKEIMTDTSREMHLWRLAGGWTKLGRFVRLVRSRTIETIQRNKRSAKNALVLALEQIW